MAQGVSVEAAKAVYNYEELSQPTTYKSWALRGAQGVLSLLIINDIYNRHVAQGAAHLYCLGITWILHNAIWVKDLEELIPVLGSVAQQYSEELENLTEEVGNLKRERESFEKQNTVLMGNLEKHEELINTDLKEKAAQFQKLQNLEKEAQRRLDETNGKYEATHQAYETLHKQLHGTATDLRRHSDQIIKKMTLCF